MAAALSVATALAVAACGGPGDAASSPEPTGVLDAYLAELAVGIDGTAWGRAVAEAEELIAGCMAEAGFEYHPRAAPAGVYSFPLVLEPGYAATFGYGETTQTLGPDLPPLRFSDQVGADPAAAWNMDYVNRLSPEAQEAYLVAMHGPEAGGDDLAAVEAAAAQGCTGQAQEVYARAQPPERLQDVQDELWDALRRIETDPRVEATLPAWSGCMADAGYPGLSTLEDGHALVTELGNAFPAPADMSWEEVVAAYPRQLAELQEAEIAIAVADTTCRDEAGWYAARRTVQPEVEAQLLDAYEAELEAFLEWIREHQEVEP